MPLQNCGAAYDDEAFRLCRRSVSSDGKVAPRPGTVRHVDLERRPLLHRVDPALGCHRHRQVQSLLFFRITC